MTSIKKKGFLTVCADYDKESPFYGLAYGEKSLMIYLVDRLMQYVNF